MNVANYYTLFTREDDGKWYPQFGDYDLASVKAEIAEYRGNYRRNQIKIASHRDDATLEELMTLANYQP